MDGEGRSGSGVDDTPAPVSTHQLTNVVDRLAAELDDLVKSLTTALNRTTTTMSPDSNNHHDEHTQLQQVKYNTLHSYHHHHQSINQSINRSYL